MAPAVSVIIPVYNRAHSVLPTLRSVQDQTMRDFECLVVDDGSADGAELQRVVEGLSDPRFRYLRRPNGGGGAARNTGIEEADGAIAAFLDSDDRWLPSKLDRDLGAGADRQVVFSPMQVERGGRIIGVRPRVAPNRGEPMAEYLACRQGFVPTSTVAVPAAVAKRVRYDEAVPFGQDADFAIRLAATGTEFVMLPDALSIMQDDEDAMRVSRTRDWTAVLAWLDRVRPLISARAYLALRGWHVSRIAAAAGQHGTALRFYFEALAKGALPPPLAAKALAQIVVPRSALRALKGSK
jgi:glycosyltransferase involved in cell wall biosynthesis